MACVVADTNIYVSAFNFGGQPSRILELAQEGAIELAVSQPILDEIERVLSGKKFGWRKDQVKDTLSNIQEFTGLVRPEKFSAVVIVEDPSDDRILECALEAKADAIVSGDHHLLDLEDFQGIPIVEPAEFLESEQWLQSE